MCPKKGEVMTEPTPVCRFCKDPLVKHHWNTSVDILRCENQDCFAYFQAQGTVKIRAFSKLADLNLEESDNCKAENILRGQKFRKAKGIRL